MRNKKKTSQKLQHGSHVAFVSMVKIFLLAVLKTIVGLTTGMVVLIADALASFADMTALFATYLGLRISQKSEDKGFRYGYYKVETVASLIVSLIIIYLGIKIFFDSLERFQELEESSYQFLGIIMVAISIIESRHMAHKLKHTGNEINSRSLINCGIDKTVDVYVQIAVFAGILANTFHIPYVEGTIGMGISLMTLKVGLESAKESLFFLLDYFDDQKMIDKIRDKIKEKSHIINDIHDIRMRRAGTVIFGEAVLDINPYIEVRDIRNELNRLEHAIENVDEYIQHFSLLIAIPHPRKIRVALPVRNKKDLHSNLADSMVEAKYYLFVDISAGKIKKFYFKEFNFNPSDFGGIVEFFEKERINVIINNNMHSLLYYNLRHLKKIQIYPNFNNVDDAENTIKLLMIDL